MIKTSDAVFEHPITSLQLELNHLFARCQCDSMKVGIKYNSTCPTLLGELTAAITLKHYASKYTQTVGFGESIFLTACTPRRSYRQSLSYSYRFRNKTRTPSAQSQMMVLKSKRYQRYRISVMPNTTHYNIPSL